MDISTHVAASQRQRLTFERLCMAIIIVVLVLALTACFVALYPAAWAKDIGDRINNVRESMVYFIGLIATNLGISFARGGSDVKAAAQANSPPDGGT